MTTAGRFTFNYEDEEGFGISMSCKEGKDIDEMLEAFEDFLFACGYRLQDGETLGITDDGILSDSGHGSEFKFDPEKNYFHWDSGMASTFINCGVRGGMANDIITFDNA